MHVSTETNHPQHIAEVDGVGVTDTAPVVIEALARLNLTASTQDVADTANLRDRQEARRSLRRLEDAGVVVSREMDVDLTGTARKPFEWTVTDGAIDAGVVERLRAGSDVPLDPVRQRDRRIGELEDAVEELRQEVDHLRDELAGYRSADEDLSHESGWSNIDPET